MTRENRHLIRYLLKWTGFPKMSSWLLWRQQIGRMFWIRRLLGPEDLIEELHLSFLMLREDAKFLRFTQKENRLNQKSIGIKLQKELLGFQEQILKIC